MIKDYYYHYIDYDHLKQVLQDKPFESARTPENPRPQRKWTEDDEKAFVAELESELEKVFTFQRVKSEEIIRRIRSSEREVNEVISQLDRGLAGHQNHEEDPSEEDFLLLEEDLSNVIADVHDLAKFTQLNYTGFQKIIKKHDVCHKQSLNSIGVLLTRQRNKPHGTSSQCLLRGSKLSLSSSTTMMSRLSGFPSSMTWSEREETRSKETVLQEGDSKTLSGKRQSIGYIQTTLPS